MTTEYCLRLIASTPSHGATHVDPDSTACLLGTYTSKAEARWAGRSYLAQHPAAWVQTQDIYQREPGEDVTREYPPLLLPNLSKNLTHKVRDEDAGDAHFDALADDRATGAR